jgi:chaperonin cofactor prefoldin
MSDEPIKLSQEIENELREISTGGMDELSREASVARLQAILATTLSRDLLDLTREIHSSKNILGNRIETLSEQIEKTRSELRVSSESANKQ